MHTEALADVGEDPADLAGADDAYGFAMEVKACQTLEAEIKVPGADVGLVGPAVDGEKQCHGVLGYGIGGVGRHPVDGELPLAGPKIHIVEARAPQRNDLHTQLIQLFRHIGVDSIVDKYAHGIVASGQRDGVFIQASLEILDLQAGIGGIMVKSGHIIGLGIKKSNFHRIVLLLLLFCILLSIKL